MKPQALSVWASVVLVGGLLALVGIAALAIGSVNVPFERTIAILLHQLRLTEEVTWTPMQATIILQVRFPRVLMAALVGGVLALSGAVMQGIFQNPMADPGLLGVSSGAALGAVLALTLGWAMQHHLIVPGCAFLGGLAAAGLVYGLATSGGKTPVATLLLSGVAVSSLGASLTSFILTRSRESMIREILFWLMGGLEASNWEHVRLTTPVVLLGVTIILFFTRDLDILLCGEQRALTLGVDAQWCRMLLLTLTTAVTAVVVSLSGTVGFVGLVVPHMLRLLVGPQHHRLLPVSFLGGALFLILADLVARVLVRPQEVRLGIISAFVGVPFFLYQLRTHRRGLDPL
jgi:iron complex transport system permease protein